MSNAETPPPAAAEVEAAAPAPEENAPADAQPHAADAAAPDLPISLQDAEQALAGLVLDSDATRVAGLGTLELVGRARARSLGRVAGALGQADPANPAANDVTTLRDANRNLARSAAVAAQVAATAPPAPADDSWTVYGHVVDAEFAPVANATVQLVDAKGTQLRGANVRTDAAGYYELVSPVPAAKAGGTPAVHVRVTAGRSKVLHESKVPLSPAAAVVDHAPVQVAEKVG